MVIHTFKKIVYNSIHFGMCITYASVILAIPESEGFCPSEITNLSTGWGNLIPFSLEKTKGTLFRMPFVLLERVRGISQMLRICRPSSAHSADSDRSLFERPLAFLSTLAPFRLRFPSLEKTKGTLFRMPFVLLERVRF
ncbi:MAG: hypothetical protein K0Q48_876 [Bacillota bacterium]|nr:hypothetical protein [Bacillota bacterium]